MAKPFDISSKMTWEAFPADFAEWLGPGGSPAVVIDADVSTVSGATDKVIRVGRGRNQSLLMVEFLTSYKDYIPERTQWHSTLLAHRHRLPVRSVIVLLRPEADGPAMTGTFERSCSGESPYLTFRYRVVRLWEVPAEELLQHGPGLLPLAPVAAVSSGELPIVVHRVKTRIEREVPADKAPELLAATYVLMGLRYDDDVIAALRREVLIMEESITYQEIIGIGRLDEARKAIVLFGTDILGKPGRKTVRSLDAITDLARLEVLMAKINHVDSWAELLAS